MSCRDAKADITLTNEPAPVSASERIVLLDSLRGFSLLGVVLVHLVDLATLTTSFGGEIHVELDRWAERLARIFVVEKAQTLFALMFGISFAIQMERLESRSTDAAGVYRRRLFGLLAIGLLHALQVPQGDILVYYALGGFVLMFLRPLDTRALAGFGLLVALVAMPTTALVLGTATSSRVAVPAVIGNLSSAASTSYEHGTYLEVMRLSWHKIWFLDHPARGLLTFMSYVIGRFMLGIAVFRTGLLTQPWRHRRTLAWAAAIGLPGGILLTISPWIVHLADGAGWIVHPKAWHALALYFDQAGILTLAAAYAALFALAWESGLGRRLLSACSPVGRMAVTNYLLQSVFVSLFFFGFGLGFLGRIGAASCILIALAFFAAQCALSSLWLRVFRYGPVEWLWRLWTYKMRPTRRRVPRAEAIAAGQTR